MSDQQARAELIARMRTRIHSLVNRGAEICQSYVPRAPLDSVPGCDRCGYQSDVHIVRDALRALEAAEAECARLTSECAMYKARHDEDYADFNRVVDENTALEAECARLREAIPAEIDAEICRRFKAPENRDNARRIVKLALASPGADNF